MGDARALNWLNTTFVLAAAFLVVFCEADFVVLRHWLGAQVDLLPPLLVYAGLRTDLSTVGLVSCLGGLWFDALSANPLGISVLPLFGVGLAVYVVRELVLRDLVFAQFVLGLAASAAAPVLTLLLLLTTGRTPLIGWGTLWQLLVMAVGGGLAAPVFFLVFDWIERAFLHGRATETSFRPDREIRRGR
jgi:hypothetical protein